MKTNNISFKQLKKMFIEASNTQPDIEQISEIFNKIKHANLKFIGNGNYIDIYEQDEDTLDQAIDECKYIAKLFNRAHKLMYNYKKNVKYAANASEQLKRVIPSAEKYIMYDLVDIIIYDLDKFETAEEILFAVTDFDKMLNHYLKRAYSELNSSF